MAYQVATGYNNVAGYADIVVQPRVAGLKAGRRTISGGGLLYEDGYQNTSLEYGFLTKAQYTALLAQFGLTSATSAKISITLPLNDGRAFDDFNAIIDRPDLPDNGEFVRTRYVDIRFPVRRIEAI